MTDDGCMYTHLSSTKHSDKLVYRRSWPTADVRIRHQRGTPTRWGLALLHCIRIMALIHHYSRDFSATTQWLADDQMARRYKQTFSIRSDVLDTTRGLGLGSTTWWYNRCYDDEMSEKATMQSYDADRKTSSERYPL